MFRLLDLSFLPGLYGNRTRRGSKQRWTDGAFVRFRDGVPEQVGGWIQFDLTSREISGVARHLRAWRPNSQLGRYVFIGCHNEALLLDGSKLSDITPSGFEEGRVIAQASAGYGAGAYGASTYGTARAVGTLFLAASQWTSAMFGEELIACFSLTRQIYSFNPVLGQQALELVPNAPTASAVAVSDERHVFAFGADNVPGRVRWSDRENRNEWAASATNRAGEYDFQVNSRFQIGLPVRGAMLGWTETDVVTLFPLNNALVYGRETLSRDAGVCGPQSVSVVTGDAGEMALWMGPGDFFLFDGFVRKLDCELHDYVYKDVNLAQRSQFHAGHLAEFREVWFFYCSAGSDAIDRAVIYDYDAGTWSKAPLARTAWCDAGVLDAPLALTADGVAYQHETGEDADGAVMGSFIVSHPITVGAGDQFADIDQFWPDMTTDSQECSITLIARDRPGGPEMYDGPHAFIPASQKVDLAVSAREVQLRLEGIGGYWKMGVPMLSVQGGGGR